MEVPNAKGDGALVAKNMYTKRKEQPGAMRKCDYALNRVYRVQGQMVERGEHEHIKRNAPHGQTSVTLGKGSRKGVVGGKGEEEGKERWERRGRR